jgi:hypothetical protein
VIFFRSSWSGSASAPAGPGEFINRPAAPPTLILLDRWNERMMTLASAWQDISSALAHLESVDRVYIYLLTSHGDLLPVHPLPEAGADLRAATPPSTAELVAKLNEAVRTDQGFRDVDVRDPRLRARNTFQALEIVVRLASFAGRKNLIWVTHGFPLQAYLPTGGLADFTPWVRSFCQTAAQAQVVVYAVDQSSEGAGADPGGVARQTLLMFAELTGGRWYVSGKAGGAIAGAMADAHARSGHGQPLVAVQVAKLGTDRHQLSFHSRPRRSLGASARFWRVPR